MQRRNAGRVGALLVGLTVALAGCGGGSTTSGPGSTSGNPGGASTGSTGGTGNGGTGGTTTVSGVAMPSSVSVVTATNAN